MCFGNSASTDRKQNLIAYGGLDKSIDKLNTLGTDLTTSGSSDTGKATKYYSDILSGDPNRVAAAIAPEAATQQKQNEQVLKQIANFGNRGGGTNQVTAGLSEKGRGNLIDMASKARGDAAGNLAGIGSTETGQGLQSNEAAARTAAELLSGSTASRDLSSKLHAAAVRNWSRLVEGVLTGTGALPAAGGWEG